MPSIASAVWGGRIININSDHCELATWDPCYASGGCCWYEYSITQAGGGCGGGCRHPGFDLDLRREVIYSPVGGRVDIAGCDHNFGFKPYVITLEGDDGKYHIFGHMREVYVRAGTRITAGTQLGRTGEMTDGCNPDNGLVGGEHLHYELRQSKYGAFVNPRATLEGASFGGGTTPPPADNSSAFAKGSRVSINVDKANFRSAPDIANNVISTLNYGTVLCIIGDRQVADGYEWYRCRIDGSNSEGYVASIVLSGISGSCTTGTPQADTANTGDSVRITAANGIYFREGPSPNYAAIGTLDPYSVTGKTYCVQDVRINQSEYPWYLIYSSYYGRSGWVSKYTSSKNILVALNQRSPAECGGGQGGGGEDGGTQVSAIQMGDKVRVDRDGVQKRDHANSTSRVVNRMNKNEEACVMKDLRSGSGTKWALLHTSGKPPMGWVDIRRVQVITPQGCSKDYKNTPIFDTGNLLRDPMCEEMRNMKGANGTDLQHVYFSGQTGNKFVKVTTQTGRNNGGLIWDTGQGLDHEGNISYTAAIDLRAAIGTTQAIIDGMFLTVYYKGGGQERGRRTGSIKLNPSTWVRVTCPRVSIRNDKRVDYVRLSLLVDGGPSESFYVDNGDVHVEAQ